METDVEHGLQRVAETITIAETEDPRYLVVLRNLALVRSDPARCGDFALEGEIERRTREHIVSERRFHLQVHPDGTYAWSESALPPRKSAAGEARKEQR
jgi:hypothetical protein